MALIGNFNAAEVEPQQDFSPVPAGWYDAQIVDSDLKATRAGNGHYAALTYEILKGEFKGRRVFVNLNLDNPSEKAVSIAQKQLSSICRAAGVMQVSDTQQLHYKPHAIRVEVELNEKGDRNNVKDWKKLDGNSTPAASGAPAPQAAAANGAPPWARTA